METNVSRLRIGFICEFAIIANSMVICLINARKKPKIRYACTAQSDMHQKTAPSNMTDQSTHAIGALNLLTKTSHQLHMDTRPMILPALLH